MASAEIHATGDSRIVADGQNVGAVEHLDAAGDCCPIADGQRVAANGEVQFAGDCRISEDQRVVASAGIHAAGDCRAADGQRVVAGAQVDAAGDCRAIPDIQRVAAVEHLNAAGDCRPIADGKRVTAHGEVQLAGDCRTAQGQRVVASARIHISGNRRAAQGQRVVARAEVHVAGDCRTAQGQRVVARAKLHAALHRSAALHIDHGAPARLENADFARAAHHGAALKADPHAVATVGLHPDRGGGAGDRTAHPDPHASMHVPAPAALVDEHAVAPGGGHGPPRGDSDGTSMRLAHVDPVGGAGPMRGDRSRHHGDARVEAVGLHGDGVTVSVSAAGADRPGGADRDASSSIVNDPNPRSPARDGRDGNAHRTLGRKTL